MSTDIRKLRIEKGLSQDGAAALAGISGHRLARIERGGTAEQAEVDKIVKALSKAKANDNSRVGKGRPGGSKSAPTKKTTTKKAATKKTTAKKTTRKPSKAAAAAAAADVL
jgi:transcriptional regulator with XRE-family HTH domain